MFIASLSWQMIMFHDTCQNEEDYKNYMILLIKNTDDKNMYNNAYLIYIETQERAVFPAAGNTLLKSTTTVPSLLSGPIVKNLPAQNAFLFECFPYVCPEPVLEK